MSELLSGRLPARRANIHRSPAASGERWDGIAAAPVARLNLTAVDGSLASSSTPTAQYASVVPPPAHQVSNVHQRRTSGGRTANTAPRSAKVQSGGPTIP